MLYSNISVGNFYKNMFAFAFGLLPENDRRSHKRCGNFNERYRIYYGTDFLVDGGATAAYFYKELRSKTK